MNGDCWTCRSNSGEKRSSPGPTIFKGESWRVEHAYPVKIKGWLVIVLKRHAEALHELTTAEAKHFYHIHFHVFAKPLDLSSDLIGRKSFALIKVPKVDAVHPEEMRRFCERLKSRFLSL